MIYFIAFFSSFAATWIFTYGIRKIAAKAKIFDYPDATLKQHTQPIPLLGGMGIYFSHVVLIFVFWIFGYIIDQKITAFSILGIVLAGAILHIGGFFDDKYHMSPKNQFLFPLLAVCVIILFGIRITYITHPFGGILNIANYFGIALTALWLLGMMYTTKLLDGLDGLVSGITFIGSFIIFIVSLFWDVPWSGTSVLALILGGSCLGFLLWNFHPAKIFLGEGGSLYLGFMLGVLSVISV